MKPTSILVLIIATILNGFESTPVGEKYRGIEYAGNKNANMLKKNHNFALKTREIEKRKKMAKEVEKRKNAKEMERKLMIRNKKLKSYTPITQFGNQQWNEDTEDLSTAFPKNSFAQFEEYNNNKQVQDDDWNNFNTRLSGGQFDEKVARQDAAVFDMPSYEAQSSFYFGQKRPMAGNANPQGVARIQRKDQESSDFFFGESDEANQQAIPKNKIIFSGVKEFNIEYPAIKLQQSSEQASEQVGEQASEVAGEQADKQSDELVGEVKDDIAKGLEEGKEAEENATTLAQETVQSAEPEPAEIDENANIKQDTNASVDSEEFKTETKGSAVDKAEIVDQKLSVTSSEIVEQQLNVTPLESEGEKLKQVPRVIFSQFAAPLSFDAVPESTKQFAEHEMNDNQQLYKSTHVPASEIGGVSLGFCEATTLGMIASLRLMAIKYPLQANDYERQKSVEYIESIIKSFPCEKEKKLMQSSIVSQPPIYTDRKSFQNWVSQFTKKLLRDINSPIGLNLNKALIPLK